MTSRLRALIVDDEAPARSELRYLLASHPEVEVVGEAASAREALLLANSVRYDVVFCDIEMPGVSGLDAARLVRERPGNPELVFVTAHERYALDAFAVEAFDYLLKPVDSDRLKRLLERLRDARGQSPEPVGKLPVVGGGATTLLDYDDVYYATADGDYSRVHTFDRSYLCTSSLRELETTLAGEHFLRIHRSTLVNLEKVDRVARAGSDRLRLVVRDNDRTELAVARRQTKALRARLRL
jgi:DNA-binding LytR/AlgR family response regulator